MSNRANEVRSWDDVLQQNPAGEILLTPRTRIGSRVSALSGMAVVNTAVTAFPTTLDDTTSSMFTVY